MFFALVVGAKAQNYNWITPGQTYLKMYVVDDGIYRIDKNDFVNAGISVSSIDPRTIKLYYKGNQLPIYFNGEQDGVFNDTDYFDFYGQRNYGGLTKTYDVYDAVNYTTDEYYNLYSDTSCYFVGWGGSYGVRFIDFSYNVSDPYPYDYYYKRIHFELDSVYSLGETFDPGNDYRYFLNDKFQGEGWYWRRFLYNNTQTSTFQTPVLSVSSPPVKFRIFAYPEVVNTSIANEQILAVKVNGNHVDTIRRNDFGKMDTTLYFPKSYLNTTNNSLAMRYSPPSAASACKLLLDMVDIYYPSEIRIDTSKLSFKTELIDTASKLFSVNNYNSSNQVFIYDVENNKRIVNNIGSGSVLNFTGNGNGKFEIINSSITKKPFRIKQRHVPNLVTNSTGVDYLIVYNKLFEAPAEQLRSFRAAKDGFRTFKAEIEDIYDVFNFGMENPIAVRNFVKNVYEVWTTPKIKYLLLFGRGSLDPKRNLKNNQYYKNFIPVYGNPISEGYFSSFNYSSFIYKFSISSGRIPCYDIQEAQDIVNKIILYEDSELGDWSKKCLMVTGGFEKSDQSSNVSQANTFINNYIDVPPNSLEVDKIFLVDTGGLVTYNYQDSLINSIERGALFLNYIGHSGANYWDYSFNNPIVLSNSTYPLIFSMACFTGKTAEPNERNYGEKFFIYPNRGAIGFISTTGWSWSSSGSQFNEYCWKGFRDDTLRRSGDFVKYAADLMDTISFAARNTINCYSLIGDPALKLKLPSSPDFNLSMEDYFSSPEKVNVYETYSIPVFTKNFGTYVDSCKVRAELFRNNVQARRIDSVVSGFSFIDTLNYNFYIDTVGNYSVKITIDPENWYIESNEGNNVVIIKLINNNYSGRDLRPTQNQIINRDSVAFILVNPNINYLKNNSKIILQLDTSKLFNSTVLSNYFVNSLTGVKTELKIKIPILDSNITYFWRYNTIINNSDTVGWNNVNNFKYSSVFNGNSNLDSLIYFNRRNKNDFQENDFSYTKFDSSGVKLNKRTFKIEARSYGGFPFDESHMLIDKNVYYSMGEPVRGGIAFAKVKKTDGSVIEYQHIFFSSSTSNDSLINFLNTYDTNHILVAIKLIPYNCNTNLNTAARNKLKEFGSIKIDSVNIVSWMRWAFISYSGMPNPITSEAYGNAGWGPVYAYMEPEFLSTFGIVNNIFGPANNWKNFSWEQVLFPRNLISFDIYGINKNKQEVLIAENLTSNNLVNLDTINAYTYPNLKMVSKLSIDTVGLFDNSSIPYGGVPSPLLKSITASYVPPSELAIDYSSLVRSDSIINAEDSLGIGVKYYNIGFKSCYGTVRNIYFFRGSERINVSSDTNYATLKVDSSQSYKTYIKFANYLPPTRKYDEQISLFFEVMPLGQQNDYYYYNNSINTDVWIKKNLEGGTFELFADGVRLLGGEYVKKNPEVTVKYSSKVAVPVSFADTSLFKFIVNGRVINIGLNKNIKSNEDFTKKSKQDDRMTNDAKSKQVETPKSFSFYPELQNGENNLKILSRISNETNFDTLKYSVLVSDEFFVKDLYNYPNPMTNNTSFMFTLAGNTVIECKIKIYTAAGRLIKTIYAPAKIGYNQVFWDGRDDDGDALANGVYFYKLIVEGDGKKETPVQRIAVLR